uniref:Uncharacterized protein n=1 Tax=Monodon monoceros TaxID=40151 RepID=A0A8C6AVL6_MONMO
MVLTLDSFILSWLATTFADLYLQHIKHSTFSCNVMTFLCFMEALPASLVALCTGPGVLFKVYGIALNTMKNTQELREITFYCDMQFTGETAHVEMMRVTSHFKWILTTLELTAIAAGDGYKTITIVQDILQLIFTFL